MAFTRQTNSIPLFASSGDYHAEAKLSYTKNEANRTFTVTVEGVRAYCKYGWNFRSNITVWLGSSSNGSDKVQTTGTISSSGSNTYKGWLPKSGYSSIKVSKTFSYNDDGSVPTVHLYLNAYNSSVKWIKAGKSTPVNVTYSGNITSEIKKIGPKDVTPPNINVWANGCNAQSVSWGCSSNTSIGEWQYRLDGGRWTKFGSSGNLSYGSVSTKPGWHSIEVCGIKSSNGKWGYSSKITYDTSLPNITSHSLWPTASNKATLSFKSNYKVDYRVTASGYDSGWTNGLAANKSPSKMINIVNNRDLTYTLTVRRSDNHTLTKSVSMWVDSRIPSISQFYFTASSAKDGKIIIKSPYQYQWRYRINSGSWSGWSSSINGDVTATTNVTLPENKQSVVYAEIRRPSNTVLQNNTSTNVDLRIPNITALTLNVTSVNYAMLTFSSSYQFSYRFYNGQWSNWSSNYDGNRVIKIGINVPHNRLSEVKVQIRRPSITYLTTSATVSSDSRLPNIQNAAIHIVSANRGTLTYSSSFTTTYTIKTTSNYEGWLNKSTVLSKSIPIHNNTEKTYTLVVRRASNANLTSSVNISCDSILPRISELRYTPTSSRGGQLIVNCPYSYQCRYRINSGNWQTWSGKTSGNTKTTFNISVPENKIYDTEVQVKRTFNGLSTSQHTALDLRNPNIKNLTCDVVSDGNAVIRFTSGYKIRYNLYYDGKWHGWKGYVNKDTQITARISVPKNSKTNITVKTERYTNGYLSHTDTVECDSRLPNILESKILVKDYDKGILTYKSSYNTIYKITTSNYYTATIGKDTVVNRNITLPRNSKTKFTLTVMRKSNPNLFTKKDLEIDTLYPLLDKHTIVTTDFEQGQLRVQPKYKTVVIVQNKEYICNAGKLTNIKITLPRDSCGVVKYKVARATNRLLDKNYETVYDTKIPKLQSIGNNTKIKIWPISRNTAHLTIKPSHDVEIKYNYDGQNDNNNNNGYWGIFKANTLTKNKKVNIKDNDNYTFKFYFRRKDIKCLYNYVTVTTDSELPIISGFTLFPSKKDGTEAKFTGKFSHQVTFNFTGLSKDKKGKYVNKTLESVETITAGNTKVIKTPLPVQPDVKNNYNIKFIRTSNSNLYVESSCVCDTRLPKTKLVKYSNDSDIYVSGSSAKLRFTPQTDLKLTNVYVNYKDLDDSSQGVIKQLIGNTNDRTTRKITIPANFNDEEIQLVPGHEYIVYITAERDVHTNLGVDTKLFYKSNTFTFTAKGGIWICNNGKLVSATVYVYDGKEWRESIPMLWYDKEDGNGARFIRTK